MEKVFNYKFQVRGYELDSFGHVNNAVYLNYFEQARWEIVQKLGILDIFKATKSFLVVVETNIKYVNELNMFDNVSIETKLYKHGYFVIFKQNIVNSESKKCAKASIKCLFVDQERTPLDIPDILLPFLHE